MTAGSQQGTIKSLKLRRRSLDRTGTAERVADILRGEISDGKLLPGIQLSEEVVAEALGVSRNTLREAFRLLSHERLLTHELNRGVFVRVVTTADVADIYRVRRVVEFSALRSLKPTDHQLLHQMDAAIAASERAAAEERWMDVGPANNEFHFALVSSLGSRRLNELLRTVLAEIRLAFWQTKQDLRHLYEPYVTWNRGLVAMMQRNQIAAAEAEFMRYFDKSEGDLLFALVAVQKDEADEAIAS